MLKIALSILALVVMYSIASMIYPVPGWAGVMYFTGGIFWSLIDDLLNMILPKD